jgi:hypothetical protein
LDLDAVELILRSVASRIGVEHLFEDARLEREAIPASPATV